MLSESKKSIYQEGGAVSMEDTCVICGKYVPEGRHVCIMCIKQYGNLPDDRSMMHELLRRSMLPEKTFNKAPKPHNETFRKSIIHSLSVFFHFNKKEVRHERTHYLPRKSKRRRNQNHFVRQFRYRFGHGREKSSPSRL